MVTVPAVLAALIVDAIGTGVKGASGFGRSGLLVLQSFAYVLLPFVLGAALLAFLLALTAWARDRARDRGMFTLGEDHRRVDVVAASLLVGPIYFLVLYRGALGTAKSFHNLDLAAFQFAVVALVALAVCWVLWLLLNLAVRRIRAAFERQWLGTAIVLTPGALLSAGALVWALVENAPGLGQLDGWLFVAAGAALLVLVVMSLVVRRTERGRRLFVWVGASLAVLGIAGGLLVGFLAPRVPGTIARNGSWSRMIVKTMRIATDFDGDGYSAWFGGGDCRPLDAEVHPGAPEIPGDSIDNNCIGGDAGKLATVKRPKWHAIPAAIPTRMNLVVVTIETLRADRVSFLGYEKKTTPKLDEIAESSVVFRRTYSASSLTRLALPALLSSYGPSEIRWKRQPRRKQMQRIRSSTPWLPEELKRAGYTTIAIHTNFRAFTKTESAGFDRGFKHYDTKTKLRYLGGTMRGFPGGAQIDKAIEYVDKYWDGPFFLWVHLVEPHFQYEAPEGAPDFGADEQGLYDAEIWGADRQVGRLAAHLRKKNLFDRTIFLVAGDHGEEFSEHGKRFHGSNLYEPQIRTAALMRVPGIGGRQIDRPVVFQDFAPTLLNLLRIQRSFRKMRGRNLTPLLLDGDLEETHFVVELFRVDNHRNYQAAVVNWPYKLVYVEDGHALELYNVEKDPEEKDPIEAAKGEVLGSMESFLFQYVDTVAKRSVTK